MYDQPLFFFDMTAVCMMLVLAYLSKRVGHAMHVRPYYVILFVTAVAVTVASGLETIPQSLNPGFISVMANSIRCAAAAIAFAVTLRYWYWLFAEFSKK